MFPYFFLIEQCLLLFQNVSFVAIWLFMAHGFLMNIQIVFALSSIHSFLSGKIFILHVWLGALSYILVGNVSLAYSWRSDGVAHKHLYLLFYSASSHQESLLLYELEENMVETYSSHFCSAHFYLAYTTISEYGSLQKKKKSEKFSREIYYSLANGIQYGNSCLHKTWSEIQG